MKTIPKIFEMLADIPRQVIDQDSVTSREIAEELGVGSTTAKKLIREKLLSGKWQQVFKKIDGCDRPVPSYRLKKKSRK